MTDFAFNPKINDPFAQITEAQLGVAGTLWTDKEVGKAVKLGTAGSNYVLCSTGNDLEGVVVSLEPFTVNGGASFGSVQQDRRILAVAGVGGVTLGAFVVAGVQEVLGTQTLGNKPVVIAGAGVAFKWRCIRIVTGTGIAGDTVLIERV